MITLSAIDGIPLVKPGDDLVSLIADAVNTSGSALIDGDIVVLAQKIVSKAEDRYVNVENVKPTAEAERVARIVQKDPRHVEAILSEATEIVAHRPGVLIVRHRLGFVMANAGIDESNIDHSNGARLLLLPENPDRSAALIREGLERRFGCRLGIVINDSFGRPWRNGVVGVAIGCSGVCPIVDLRGARDLFGRTMRVTEIAAADELASAASLLMGQLDQGRPVILVRGYETTGQSAPASAIVRPPEMDMFRQSDPPVGA